MDRTATRNGFHASHAAVVGRFTYRPRTDTWWWSDAMYAIYGFDPGVVMPSTELVLRHVHPDDRDAAWDLREATVDHKVPFSFLHRITTAANVERVVLAAGHLEDDEHGEPVINGHLVDLTEVRQDAVAEAVDPAVADFAENRALIEQAKGVLMQLYSVDETTAFALLRPFSMDANLKVRDVAALLVEGASKDLTPVKGRPPSAHDVLEQLHGDLSGR